MSGRTLATALAFAALVAGCAHPEDRRWAAMNTAAAQPDYADRPQVSVYAFSPPKAGARTGLRDLSGHGQAALIEAIARAPGDAAALRKLLAAPLEGDGSGGAVDRTRLARTIVLSVRKAPTSMPGDRLMRTIITLKPHAPRPERSVFEFSGYSIAATDTRVQDIARLETSSGASLSVGAEPSLGPLGAGSIGAEVSRSETTSADIVQQYENLGIDITPGQLVVTRESERGLDVVGNTLIALTLAPTFESERAISGFLAKDAKLYDKGAPLAAAAASMDIASLGFLTQCDLKVDVDMSYQLRRITKGREFYTEGKQSVEIVSGDVPQTTQTLVRSGDVQPPLYVVRNQDGDGLLAAKNGSGFQLLYFESFGDAKRFASWLDTSGSDRVGGDGLQLRIEAGRPWSRTDRFEAAYFGTGCP